MKNRTIYTAGMLLLLNFSATAQHVFKGSWITRTGDTSVREAPLFRKVFKVSKPVSKATAFICGLGYHNSSVNGKPVSDGVLEQVFTNYSKRLQYGTYDVTGSLKQGLNCFATELGNGWYNMQSKNIWSFDRVSWRNTPRLLADLVLEYKDGTRDTISSDTGWKTNTGAGLFNSLLAGEIYDARKEIKGWNLAGFEDKNWLNAKAAVSPGGKPEAQVMPGITLIREITPVSVRRVDPHTWLFDMGENFAGVARLQIKGKQGDTVIMKYGEVLTPSGAFDTAHNTTMMIYEPGDPKFQTDVYILKGSAKESYTPRFTYHGFQYVQVTISDPAIRMDKSSLTGLFYSTGFQSSGSFKSSDAMLNKLYAAAIQSYRSNYYGMPTDCPTREKMGWQADGVFISESGLWNFNAASAYRKWLDDMMDSQVQNGLVGGVAPTDRSRGYYWPIPPDSDYGPLWCSGEILLPWYLYLYDGDTASVRKSYASGKAYMNYMISRAKDNLYTTGLGDWLAIDTTTSKTISSSAYYYNNARIMAKMAGLLGNTADLNAFNMLGDKIKAAFNERFFDFKTKQYKASTLTAISSAIYYGLCPDQYKAEVQASLRDLLRRKNYKIDYGLLGSKTMFPALTAGRYADDAYRLLTDTTTGYGKMIARGSTTLWEDWKGEFSRNHPSFGSYCAWFYDGLAGIKPTEKGPGFKRFTIEPMFPKGLEWIQVKHTCKYGEIGLSWKRKAGFIELEITVPKGTSAEVLLKGYEQDLEPGTHTIQVKI